MSRYELRFGNAAALYFGAAGKEIPNQPDLLDLFFPGFIISEDPERTGQEAEYIDAEYMIRAGKKHGRFYVGGSTRVSQILGRLTGTAKGNREKERRSAELIRRHLSTVLVKDRKAPELLLNNLEGLLDELDEEQLNDLAQRLTEFCVESALFRFRQTEYERESEPFAMYDEVFDGVIYNAVYQLTMGDYEGLVNAFLWILTGSLLRNESWQLVHLFDSSFHPAYRQAAETESLLSKLEYLLFPEDFEPVYDGEQTGERFPDIHWYCDSCGALLNRQEGFDDHLDSWKCLECGAENRISASDIYQNFEYAADRRNPEDPEKIRRALEEKQK
ncbi:MAG: hypothetical protein K6D03_05005 [Solobacterium sp.]|nr:hypothetical protein [Solobacterium sp.]